MHLFFLQKKNYAYLLSFFVPFFCYTKNGERSGGHMYTTGWQAEPFLPQLRQEKSELHRAKHLDRRTTASKERNWTQFYMFRFGTSHKSCTSELPKFAKSERCKWFDWLFLEPDTASLGAFVTGGVAEGTGQQCRTLILCVMVSVEALPVTLTKRTAPISLVASHHQFCCTPSTHSSFVKKSSWWTATSIVSPGSMRPTDGWTYLTLQGQIRIYHYSKSQRRYNKME